MWFHFSHCYRLNFYKPYDTLFIKVVQLKLFHLVKIRFFHSSCCHYRDASPVRLNRTQRNVALVTRHVYNARVNAADVSSNV